MPPDLVQLRVLAEKKEDENWRFRQFLKTHCNLEPEELDQRVFETTRRVWARIDCTTCANCCREVKPTFSEDEVNRLAQRLAMPPQQFIDAYLEPTEPGDENPWQTRTTPCPFLKDTRCSVYDDRPANCKGYPYLYEPQSSRAPLMRIAHEWAPTSLQASFGHASHMSCEKVPSPLDSSPPPADRFPTR